MTMIDAHFDDQPMACGPNTHSGVAFPSDVQWPKAVIDAVAAQDLCTTWLAVYAKSLKSIADVRAQIAAELARIAAVRERAAAAAPASCDTDSSDLRSELELKGAYLRVHVLRVTLRHLEALERRRLQDVFGFEDAGFNRVSSPSWEIWQGFISGVSTEGGDLPTEEVLAQEMVDAGLLRDAEAKLVAWAIRYLTNRIAMCVERGLFFEEIARPFVSDYFESLSMAAAGVRTLAARWMVDGHFETGSAAAIAKRLNPLGAPPHFA
ncbi:hypothetical protein [Burkholderia vietnamiensis]|uniref:hypothetical protein n=1 Tax=Burkholderia vietnamiensis TaxID=60552 RepID=UPI001CF5F6A6|nr:hypothetical protein [Burkholderia vietnamiensis]MCA8286984.1 hypothetical protein [Burkholderia vietnamiensis]